MGMIVGSGVETLAVKADLPVMLSPGSGETGEVTYDNGIQRDQ